MSDTDSIASYGLSSSAAFNKTQAKKHLEILTRPSFETYNVPKWVARVPLPKGVDKHKFNMKHLFDAMYQTTTDLHLVAGARYVSAAICACAARAAEEPQDRRLEQLAAELCKLGGTWVAYMMWPFIGNSKPPKDLEEHSDVATPSYDRTASMMDEGNTAHVEINSERRSGQFYLKPEDAFEAQLEAAHIFRRSVTVFKADKADASKRASLASTYDILKHYCQLDDKFAKKAEEEANTYKVRRWIREKQITQAPVAAKVTFKDHSQTPNTGGATVARRSGCGHSQPDDSIALPSPQLLQLHAALAGVLNMSGAAEILQMFKNPPDSDSPAVRSDYGEDFEYEVIKYDGDKLSRMRDLAAAVEGLLL
ncbi:hypothetical protein EVG20_g7350 [Dentipellis fragilis]|uniref:Uncharacterized protein n=1 Tax=Dentipellis fragilis TaxID=205917 RepID=A0A4Y9YGQ1_9AGAM|nr:hypothetical protein EVG20_g7350 [Dentipellis fragilis]